jgi:hypothetical protein
MMMDTSSAYDKSHTGRVQSHYYFLWVFAILFIILGLGYDTLTPIFEHSDETLHYPYVKHLADGKGLPLAVPGQLWKQEGTQHPLYYAIVAASTFWIDSDNLSDHLQRNPHWLFSEVRALINDNQNVVLHGPMDAFPYRRAALAIHIGRWWSLAFGAFTVVCTFLLVRHLFPHNLPLTITATALTALNPQFIRISATVSNDSLSAALTTLTVLLALKFTGHYALRTTHYALRTTPPLLLGLLTGLALLTKLSSLTTLFLVAFIIFWRLCFLSEIHQAPMKTVIRWLVIIIAITAALTGWWFWRNFQLYGEWLATETHLNLAGRADLSLAEAWGLRTEAERAYWATFGWGQIRPPEWVYRLLFLCTRLSFIGILLVLLAKLIQGAKSRPLPLNLRNISFAKIIILLLWATMNLMLYLRWVMSVGSVSHTRLVFPAIAAISLLLALGWHALLPQRLEGWFSGLVTTLLLALNIYSLGWLIYPAFRPVESLPRQTEASASPTLYSLLSTPYSLLPTPSFPLPTSEINLTFLDGLKLAKGQVYPQNKTPTTKPQASQEDTVIINVLWQVLAPMDKNYSIAAVLHAPDGSVLARRETYPGLGLRPTRYLNPNEAFVDAYPLKLEVDVSEPLVAQATVNLFDFNSETRTGFPALDAKGNEVTPIIGQIKLVPQTWPEYHPQHPVQANFGHAISLIGYDLTPDMATLVLYWASLAPVSEDYVVFIHLLDPTGNTIAQADAPPTNNAYPTSWWSPSEVIADSHTLPTNPDANILRLGLYRLDSGQRLTIAESTLPTQDNSVEIVRQ